MYARRLAIITSMIVLAVIVPVSAEAEDLELKLWSVQDVYALKEPVKFYARLTNVSDHIVRIWDSRELTDFDIDYLYFEIEKQSGLVDTIYCRGGNEYVAMINKRYSGEPLRPGASIQTRLYPVLGYLGQPGIYKLKVIYHVPDYYEKLWKGADDKLYSNEIEIKMRVPTYCEKEIFDAIWARG